MNKNALFLFNIDPTLYSMWDKKESLTTFLRQNSMFYLGIINGLEKNGYRVFTFYNPNVFFGFKLFKYRYLNILISFLIAPLNRTITSYRLINLIKRNKVSIVISNPSNFCGRFFFRFLDKNKILSIQWFGIFPHQVKFHNKILLKNTPRYDITCYSGNIDRLFEKRYEPRKFVKIFNPNIIRPNKNEKKTIDVLFIGGLQFKHSKRWDLLEELKFKLKDKIQIFGYGKEDIPDNFIFKQQINNPIYGNQYIKKIRESKIVLNLFLDGYKNFHGVNNRIFEVLTLNSFILTQHNDGINDFFDIGSEIITFKSNKDLMDKIEFYLENDKERLLIQKRGYKRAIHYNNYNFINQLLRYSKTNL